ncbi:MAG: NAD+ synthase, partial [bacterium]
TGTNAEVVLNLSASPFHSGKRELRHKTMLSFARRTHTAVCYCNLVGGQDDLVFDGGSVFALGNRIAVAAQRFKEDLLVADVHASPTGTRTITSIETDCETAHSRPKSLQADENRIGEVLEALLLGTRDYVHKNGFKKVVIGLSGGVDSALTAAVAVQALGRDSVVGVTMPSKYSSTETRADAELSAARLGITILTLPITPVYEAYCQTLRAQLGDGESGVPFENLQARIRGTLLMALSNHYGWLVLTTGNKSELAVGYCTLYGDMAGGFSIIKDLPKTTVYELAEYINATAGQDLIPRSVIQRAPTAELRPNQKDEDSLPPYPILDPIIDSYVSDDKSIENIAEAGADPVMARKVVEMIDSSEFKRRQASLGVKITPRAFGRDRRMPITNRYRAQTPSSDAQKA